MTSQSGEQLQVCAGIKQSESDVQGTESQPGLLEVESGATGEAGETLGSGRPQRVLRGTVMGFVLYHNPRGEWHEGGVWPGTRTYRLWLHTAHIG